MELISILLPALSRNTALMLKSSRFWWGSFEVLLSFLKIYYIVIITGTGIYY